MYAEALTVMREDAAISHDTDTYNGVRRETWTMKKRKRAFVAEGVNTFLLKILWTL